MNPKPQESVWEKRAVDAALLGGVEEFDAEPRPSFSTAVWR